MLTTSLILRPQTWAERFDWKISARRDSSLDSKKQLRLSKSVWALSDGAWCWLAVLTCTLGWRWEGTAGGEVGGGGRGRLQQHNHRHHDRQWWPALSGKPSRTELSMAFFSTGVLWEETRWIEANKIYSPQPVIICLRKKFDLPFWSLPIFLLIYVGAFYVV